MLDAAVVVAVVVLLVEGDRRQLRQRVHDVLALRGRRQTQDQQRDSTAYLAGQVWLGVVHRDGQCNVGSAWQQGRAADKADTPKVSALRELANLAEGHVWFTTTVM